MARPQSTPGNVRRRIKPAHKSVSLQELIIWSIGSLVVAMLIFGSLAAITLGPRYIAALGLTRTANAGPAAPPLATTLPVATPIAVTTVTEAAMATPSATPALLTTQALPPATSTPPISPSLTPSNTLLVSTSTLSPAQSTTTPASTRLSSATLTRTPTAVGQGTAAQLTATRTFTPTRTPTGTLTIFPTATRTPTTTLTSAPTITPTITPTVTTTFTPTATTPPPGWAFVSVRLHPNPSANSVTVYGEAVNNTGATQRINLIAGTFYNAQGQVVVTLIQTSGYWPVDVLPSGGRVPFEMIAPGTSDPASYTLAVQSQTSTATPRTDFEFTRQGESIGDGLYCAQAAFRNPGADLSSYLYIVLILYNDQNNVINLSEAYEPSLAEIAGGQSHDMEVCADPLGLTVDHYEWRAWGR